MGYLKVIIDKNNWVTLNDYLNFLNYDLLEHILTKFKQNDLQLRMNKYVTRISKFFKYTRLRDFVECWPLGDKAPRENLHKFLVAKTTKDWNTCTLEELDNTRKGLARKLFLPTFALILEDASKGCVSMIFSIPPSLVARLKIDMKLMEQSIFMEMDIETITVDDVVCYEAPLLHCTTHLDQSHHNIEVCSNPGVEELFHYSKCSMRVLTLYLVKFHDNDNIDRL